MPAMNVPPAARKTAACPLETEQRLIHCRISFAPQALARFAAPLQRRCTSCASIAVRPFCNTMPDPGCRHTETMPAASIEATSIFCHHQYQDLPVTREAEGPTD